MPINGRTVTISGPTTSNRPTFDGQGARRPFLVNNGGHLTLRNVILTNGKQQRGGCLWVRGQSTLHAFDTGFSNCHAEYNDPSGLKALGGALYSREESNVELTDVTISDSSATSTEKGAEGGALAFESAMVVSLTRVTISNCHATSTVDQAKGGAIQYSPDALSTLTVNNLTVTGCHASSGGSAAVYGGAVSFQAVLSSASVLTVAIRDSYAQSGSGNAFGGGAYINYGEPALSALTMANCQARTSSGTAYGGGLYFRRASPLSHTISHNIA